MQLAWYGNNGSDAWSMYDGAARIISVTHTHANCFNIALLFEYMSPTSYFELEALYEHRWYTYTYTHICAYACDVRIHVFVGQSGSVLVLILMC